MQEINIWEAEKPVNSISLQNFVLISARIYYFSMAPAAENKIEAFKTKTAFSLEIRAAMDATIPEGSYASI